MRRVEDYLNPIVLMQVTKEDQKFITDNFFSLYFCEQQGKMFLKGRLNFVASFIYENKEIKYKVYNNLGSASNDVNVIHDEYEIEINLSADNVYREVRELGGKIEPKPSLHINPNYFVCISGYLDEDLYIKFKDFICSVVIPFFYDQSYFKQYGFWPRGEYSHGVLGILENYYEKIYSNRLNDIDTLTRKCIESIKYVLFKQPKELMNLPESERQWSYINGIISKGKLKNNIKCIECNLDFRISHRKAFKGIKLFRQNIYKYNLFNFLKYK